MMATENNFHCSMHFLQRIEMKNFEAFAKLKLESLVAECEIHKEYGEAALRQKNLYRSPNGYFEWNTQLKICFAAGSSLVAVRSYEGRDVLTAKVGELTRESVLNMAPPRYLSKELCEAFMQTPVPVLTKDVLEVLPYMHIMLPRNFVFDHYGDEVVSLVVKAGEAYPKETEEETEKMREMCKVYFPDAVVTPKGLHGSQGIQVATITTNGSNFWQEFIDENAKSWHEENIKHRKNSGYDKRETEVIVRIAINSLLVHLYEPRLITKDLSAPTKGIGFKKGPGKDPIAPTWIGKGFRYERDRQAALPGRERASGAIRAHWRRGHWHSYLVNKGKKDRIVKWVKPVYVKGCA
ncbi:MAG: hypothetical protein ACO29Z_08285 [Crocinitomicaceae bacterium]